MKPTAPLAARMRPNDISEYIGQSHLLDPGKPLWSMIKNKKIYSMILWGPPGTGKTTLARLIAKNFNAAFEQLSAVMASIKDIRDVVSRAQTRLLNNEQTVLFVDEVHRFNKTQQDAFLPYIEDGTFIFIGATTENPSFELIYALLSRAKVFVLERLNHQDLEKILDRALSDRIHGFNNQLSIEPKAKTMLINMADGDARRLLNRLEWLCSISDLGENNTHTITVEHVEAMMNGEERRFDKQGDAFYDQISALHKSIRGSDPDAALYWLCRMLDGGCDPIYLARRLIRVASEDIGNADPRAISLCLDAWEVQKRLGSPEGELTLAQLVVYLAVTAKSNATYTAFNKAMQAAKSNGSLEVPKHLKNAPTKLMKGLGYGKDYQYAHNQPYAYVVGEKYFPDQMNPEVYYQPTDRGFEMNIKKKLDFLRNLDNPNSTENINTDIRN